MWETKQNKKMMAMNFKGEFWSSRENLDVLLKGKSFISVCVFLAFKIMAESLNLSRCHLHL